MIVFRPHMRRRGSVQRTYMAPLPPKFLNSESVCRTQHRWFPPTYETVLTLKPKVRAWLDENMSGEWWTDLDRPASTVRPMALLFLRGENNIMAFQLRWG